MIGWMAGFAAGAVHALAGPDHLAAVAPLVVDRPRRAWRLGLRWGAGHALAVSLMGGLALALRHRLDVEALGAHGETATGLALVGLGLWGWRRAQSRFVHVHEHEHDGTRHRHVHLHADGIGHEHPEPHHHRHLAFGLGILHGLGGASHLLGVLPALLMPGRVQAVAYVVSFALGTLAAMVACSGLLAAVTTGAGGGVRTWRWLMSGAASASLGVGLVWLISS
jgi:hypothetical protein